MSEQAGIVIRAATADDAEELAGVLDRAWRAAYTDVLDRDAFERSSIETWLAALSQHTDRLRTIVAAEPNGAVVGFARFGQDPTADVPATGYLASLYVDPDAAGKGVGSQLLEAVIDSLSDDGWSAVSLWVFRENERARTLYERFGFRSDGTETVDPRWRVPQIRYCRALSPRLHPSAADSES